MKPPFIHADYGLYSGKRIHCQARVLHHRANVCIGGLLLSPMGVHQK